MPCTRRNWLATGARFLEAAQIDAPLALGGLGKGLGCPECYRSIDLYVDLLAYRQNNSRYLLPPKVRYLPSRGLEEGVSV